LTIPQNPSFFNDFGLHKDHPLADSIPIPESKYNKNEALYFANVQTGVYLIKDTIVITSSHKQKTSSEPLEVRNVPSEDLRLDFSVFPNPASKRVSVNVSNEFFESGQASLITIDGRVVQSKAVNAKQFNFELNNLNPGVYLITLQSGNQKSSKELIVE